ncbi:LptF/LptG family permease, partial [Planctomycetota bacterium]
MWKLDRYIAREILKTFMLSITIFTIVFSLVILYKLLREGYNPNLILVVLPFAVGYTAPYLVPVSLCIACALAYGRLTADNEYIPILTGGIHPLALLWPGLLFGIVVSVLMYGVQATVVPYCYYRKKSVMLKILEDLVALPRTENKTLSDQREGFFFFARRTAGDQLEGVELALFPSAMGSVAGARGGSAGRGELLAERGRIRQRPDGRVEIELKNATVTYFTIDTPSPQEILESEGESLANEGQLALAQRLRVPPARIRKADLDDSGALDGNELAGFLAGLDLTELPSTGFNQIRL